MIPCLLVLGIVLSCPSGPSAPLPAAPALRADPPAADPWVGQDKLQHLALSFAAGTYGYGVARFAMAPQPAAWTGAGLALAAGVTKEIVDHRAGGGFSLRDLVWDAAGVALALTLADGIR